jgi:sec-independent protein translocase protein TatC
MTGPDNNASNDREQPLIEHLVELRSRLLRSLLAVLAVFLALAPFSRPLYSAIASPLIDRLPANASMIATEVASPFLVPFKLTIYIAVFVAMPYILYQAWAFVAPALYKNEKRVAYPLLLSSIVLFYAGIAFAFFLVFPLLFRFFTSVAPAGVTVMTDISHYLDFILKMFFAFGLAFEIPIATILMVSAGIVSVESLAGKRPYIIVAAFVVGMLLTPPDVMSQVMLAVPILALFELGLFFSRRFAPKEDEENKE